MLPSSLLAFEEVQKLLGEDARSAMAESGASNYTLCLLSNVGRLSCQEPFEVAPGVHIRCAKSGEQKVFRSLVIPENGHFPSRILGQNPYEQQLLKTPNESGGGVWSLLRLTESEFRYHVMVLHGGDAEFHAFVRASALTPWQLVAGPEIQLSGSVSMCAVGAPDHERFLREVRDDSGFICLGNSELEELRDVHLRLKAFSNGSVALKSAISDYYELRAIPSASPLRFLGCMSILESILTHAPKPTDPYDSINRQVRQKMLLLQRRFSRPLPYKVFRDDADPGTIWRKLYSYRSAVAHGARPDFDKDFQILRGPSEALAFIASATRLLLRQALEEPYLIGDLREC